MESESSASKTRIRWAAIGAAVAVSLGAGSIGIIRAVEPAGATAYVPITPCRLLDTRPAPDNVGNRNTPIGTNTTHTVSAHGNNGNCTGIPATATGLSLNVTALNATGASFLTIWPTGATRPLTANLNPTPGEPPTPNAVTTGLSATGQFDIYNLTGNVDVVVDVFGYYTGHSHTGADIVDGSLNGDDIANGSLSNIKTSNEPGVSSSFSTDGVEITSSPTSVGLASIRVPSDGYVTVNVTGDWINSDLAIVDEATCQIQKGAVAAIDGSQPFFRISEGVNDNSADGFGFSAHRTLPIAAADNPLLALQGQSLRLTCDETSGDVDFDNVHITATFFASEYSPINFTVVIPTI